MTYRGVVSNGVAVLNGEKPIEGTVVDVTPVTTAVNKRGTPASHPAIGIWKDRTDLPPDPVEASRLLRHCLMHRSHE